MAGILFVLNIIQTLWCIHAVAQTTSLPPPAQYTEGHFTDPNTTVTQIYSAGSSMIVSWETVFQSTTIYLIFAEDYNAPRVLISGTSKTSFQWNVDDYGNNSLPFVIRAVDAMGSTSDKQGKGFLSGHFWIKNELDSSSLSSTSSLTSTHTTSTIEATADSERPSETSSTPTTVKGEGSEVSFSAAAPPQTSTAETEGLESATSPEQPATSTPEPSVNTTAIGVGAGLGTVILFAIAALVAVFLLRRRRRRRDHSCALASDNTSQSHEELVLQVGHSNDHRLRDVKHDPGLCTCTSKGFVEAPSGQDVPHELDGAHIVHEAGGSQYSRQ
ncbi:hypothetical protein Q7P37_000049 [Cladosporium fusiforme]